MSGEFGPGLDVGELEAIAVNEFAGDVKADVRHTRLLYPPNIRRLEADLAFLDAERTAGFGRGIDLQGQT